MRNIWGADLAVVGLGSLPQAPQLFALLRAPAPGVKASVVSEAQGLPGRIVFYKKTSSPAESEPAEERPSPLPSSLSEAGALLPVGPPAGGTGEASPRPQPAAPFNPCLSGLLSLHSVCH